MHGGIKSNGSSSEEVPAEELHKKCLVELKYNFYSLQLFSVDQTKPTQRDEKGILTRLVFERLQKGSAKRRESVQFHVQNIALMSKECQKHLENAFAQWSYKSKSEDPEKIMQLMSKTSQKGGKDLEYNDSHDLEKTKRYRNLRNPRRRLN